MEQEVYVDVLLVTNYVVNMLLIVCAGKIAGRKLIRRRIVFASLAGAAASLSIFMPSMGFFLSILFKIAVAAVIVIIAFPYISLKSILKEIFMFFAVSFFFAGAMLGVMLLFAPRGMSYYNGVVYFHISSLLLIGLTVAAYLMIALGERLLHSSRLSRSVYRISVYLGERSVTLDGLVDSGNTLREPFSGIPVAVCYAGDLMPMLPPELISAVIDGKIYGAQMYGFGVRIRLIPYDNIGGSGVLPAFLADFMTVSRHNEHRRIERAYIGLSKNKIGDGRYSCLLHPELAGIENAKRRFRSKTEYSQQT